jgi:polyphosphate kinase
LTLLRTGTAARTKPHRAARRTRIFGVMHAPPDLPLYLNPELSLLAFQRRVLALVDDPTVPLLERLRFLGIVSGNIDEFYMVRMAELRRAARAPSGGLRDQHHDGHSASSLLDAVDSELETLVRHQSRSAEACLAAASEFGAGLVRWRELSAYQRAALSEVYATDIQPVLTPLAITRSPGIPLPHLPHFGLFLGIVYRATPADRPHLVEHELPSELPRLVPVPESDGAVIPLEEVLRANAVALSPSALIDGAYLFRVTRGGDLMLADEDRDDLLEAVATATTRRLFNPAVRVEVEANTPDLVCALILDNLQRDARGRDDELTVHSVQRVDGLLDLRCLSALPLPRTATTEYPEHTPRRVFAPDESVLRQIEDRDLFVHHPFDSFDNTVVRFFDDAADDPCVRRISATLYRVGTPSPIVSALLRAAARGAEILVMVELQARFDESHNVQWARALERAGGSVVHGLPGLKVHAKLALVERRENGAIQSYAHIGTGNYNPRSGRQYTDFSLFTTRTDVTDDVASVFASFAMRRTPEPAQSGGLLVAPLQLLPALCERIAREAAHARNGIAAAITIKVNGLADREVVAALYDASCAGVTINLIVRGICTLRPGVPGLSENIRVWAVVGRWLEHSRVYRFANGGDPEYLVGSSDLRPRNLRRRVEVLVAVTDDGHRAQLDAILERYLDDATAFELMASGEYARAASRTGMSAQDTFHRLRATPDRVSEVVTDLS